MVWAFKWQQTAYSGEAHDNALCNPRLSLQMGAWFYSRFGTNEGGGFLCFSLPQGDIELELKWSWSQEDELSEPPLSKGDCSRKLGNMRRGIRSERWWRKEKDQAGDPSPKAGTLLETQHVDSVSLGPQESLSVFQPLPYFQLWRTGDGGDDLLSPTAIPPLPREQHLLRLEAKSHRDLPPASFIG